MTTLNFQYPDRLNRLLTHHQQHLIAGGLKGIEKESLRISKQGRISPLPHPISLGSALTHSHITTDYSEALLEFITPPYADIAETLAFMHTIHQYVYAKLGDEILLSTSMPCGINGDSSIPIAQYGQSNIGQMKTIYRRGLSYRYGRTMQAIAGIHFNYSVPESLWSVLYKQEQSTLEMNDFISKSYFEMIRNFQRQGWLVLYLFGASPAICKSFFKSRPHLMSEFDEFDPYTLYHPYATSLRMSDIGYKSKNQANLKINYNTLSGYVESLSHAIETPYPDYEKFGIKENNEYKQLNSNILQIENEFYSTVRPKQITQQYEKPTLALKRRGVKYIEIRSLDLDLFNPIGIANSTAYFVEAFLLHCLLQESPEYLSDEQNINNRNQLVVAHAGRQPGLRLNRGGESVLLSDWAAEILQSMQIICRILDDETTGQPYSKALEQQLKRIKNPDLTPSAQIIQQMKTNHQPFGCYGVTISKNHQNYFKQSQLDAKTIHWFEQLAEESHQQQANLEAEDRLNFDDFLQHYFSQK